MCYSSLDPIFVFCFFLRYERHLGNLWKCECLILRNYQFLQCDNFFVVTQENDLLTKFRGRMS